MTSIIVFGKPRSFESYEYFLNSNASCRANFHAEPLLKPNIQFPGIFHFYTADGFAFYEYYTHTQGYETDRGGLIYGVCIKTRQNLNLFKAKESIMYFYNIFQPFLLENNRFKVAGLLDALQKLSIEWDKNDIEQIQGIENNVQVSEKSNKEILLLEVPNLKDISVVDAQVKKFAEVYIFENKEILVENSYVLKAANNKIFKILKGKIVSHNTLSQEEEVEILRKKLAKAEIEIKILQEENQKLKLENAERIEPPIITKTIFKRIFGKFIKIKKLFFRKGNTEFIDESRSWHKKPIVWLLPIIFIIVLFFFKDAASDLYNKVNMVIVGSNPRIIFNSYDGEIKENLTPLLSTIENCNEKEIVFNVEPEKLASIEDSNNRIILSVNTTEQKKNSEAKWVTVIASYKRKELGRKSYKIAPGKSEPQPIVALNKYASPIKIDLPNFVQRAEGVQLDSLSFDIKPQEHKQLVKIDLIKNKLIVNENPAQITPITISVKHNDIIVTEQTYSIAKNDGVSKRVASSQKELIIFNSVGTQSKDITLKTGVRSITFTPNVEVYWPAVDDLKFSYPGGLSAEVSTEKAGVYTIVVKPKDRKIHPQTIKVRFQ